MAAFELAVVDEEADVGVFDEDDICDDGTLLDVVVCGVPGDVAVDDSSTDNGVVGDTERPSPRGVVFSADLDFWPSKMPVKLPVNF